MPIQVHYDEPGAGGLFNFNDIDDDDEDDDENDLEDNTAFKGFVHQYTVQ